MNNFPLTPKTIDRVKIGTVIGLISPDGYCVAVKVKPDVWTVSGLETVYTDAGILAAAEKPGQSWHYIGWYNN